MIIILLENSSNPASFFYKFILPSNIVLLGTLNIIFLIPFYLFLRKSLISRKKSFEFILLLLIGFVSIYCYALRPYGTENVILDMKASRYRIIGQDPVDNTGIDFTADFSKMCPNLLAGGKVMDCSNINQHGIKSAYWYNCSTVQGNPNPNTDEGLAIRYAGGERKIAEGNLSVRNLETGHCNVNVSFFVSTEDGGTSSLYQSDKITIPIELGKITRVDFSTQ